MASIECKMVKGKWYAFYVTVKREPGEPYPVKKYENIGRVGGKYVREDRIK